MRRILTPCVVFCSAAVQTVKSHDGKQEHPAVLLRRTNLPVYAEEIKNDTVEDTKDVKETNTFMMEAVKSFRVQGCKVAQKAKSMKNRCSQFIETGKAHSYASYQNATEFLRDEKNLLPRIGVIGGGLIVGYTFGLRRGFIKRILYTSVGGASAAAVCYPDEAHQYYESSIHLSKRYVNIGYHFANGVTKDFLGLELPTLPQKIQEQQESPVNASDAKDE